MIMALGIATKNAHIQVAAGYESGHTVVFVQRDPGAAFENLYSAQTHVQPSKYYLPMSPLKLHLSQFLQMSKISSTPRQSSLNLSFLM